MTARRALGVATMLVLVALLVAAASRLDLHRALLAMGDVRLAWVLAAILAYLAILPLWAVQWHALSPPTPHRTVRRMLGVVALTASVLNTTPLLVGEAAGVLLLVTRIGLARSAAVSVLAMDQLLVGIAKVCVLGSAAMLLPLPAPMRHGLQSLLVVVALLVMFLGALAWRPALMGLVARRLPPRLTGPLHRTAAALSPLLDFRLGGLALVLALLKKLAELAAIVAMQRAFGVELPLASALLVLGALNLATLLPVLPGNVGLFEGAMVIAYRALGVPAEQALAIAVLQHACYFVALALPGYRWIGDVVPARRTATS